MIHFTVNDVMRRHQPLICLNNRGKTYLSNTCSSFWIHSLNKERKRKGKRKGEKRKRKIKREKRKRKEKVIVKNTS